MKKILHFILFLITFNGIAQHHAQDHDSIQKTKTHITTGIGLALNTHQSSIGIHVTGQLFVTEVIAVSPSFTQYSLPVSIAPGQQHGYEVNIDVNYYLKLGKLMPYGLVGANYSRSSKDPKYGINTGLGLEYHFGKKARPFLQLKHTFSLHTQVSVGVRFKF